MIPQGKKIPVDLTADYKELTVLTTVFGIILSPLLTFIAKIQEPHLWNEFGTEHVLILLSLAFSGISLVLNLSCILIRQHIKNFPLIRVLMGSVCSIGIMGWHVWTNPLLYGTPFIIMVLFYISALGKSNRKVKLIKLKR